MQQPLNHLLLEGLDPAGAGALLARLLDIIRANDPGEPAQHVLCVGPRGMGKTTLLCAIAATINLLVLAIYPTLIAQGVTEKDATLLMDDMNMRETGRGQQDQRWIRACQAAYRQR